MAQEDVLIKFEVDYTELDNAISALEKTGKLDPKTAAQFNQTSKAITNVGADTAELIKTFKDVAGASVKMGKTVEAAFGAGVQDALDDAGVSVEEFGAALKKANAPAVTLKKELAQLKEQMARLKAAGKDTGTEFDTLRKKAGSLADAIADTNAEIKNAGSDTRGLDNVLGSVTALAGGYSAIQGATALFGEENEDLQKALLKVNGAMAIAQGLQVVYNATLKEGALTKLADSIATGAQSAAMTLYTYVTTGATVATKIYRAALIATGIGAIVILVLALVDAFSKHNTEVKDAKVKIDELNDSYGKLTTTIKNLNDEQASIASSQGLAESKILKIRLEGVQKLIEANRKLEDDKRVAITNAAKDGKTTQALQDEVIATFQEGLKLRSEQRVLEAQIAAAEKKELEDRIKANIELGKKKEEAIEKARKKEMDALALIIAANLKADQDREDQLRTHFENEQDITERDRAAKEAINNKWDALRLEMQKTLVKSSEEIAAKQQADEKKRLAEREEEFKKRTATMVEIGNQITQIYSQIADAQKRRDDQFIKSQREKIDAELKAGVISTKEADARQKRVDEVERRAKNKAAKREKSVAVFQAALAIPTAFLKGLNSGGIQLAVVYAALAAVQAAVVASQPVPQFFRGKKDKYEGPGIVGDMGSELVERGGRMFLYTKPTQTYLGANDKVYTAAETRQIMHNTNISTTVVKDRPERFDYDRFAKAIPAAGINISIDKDGITKWGDKQRSRETYLTRKWRNK